MSDLRDIARRMIAASGKPRRATSLAEPERARARSDARTIWVAIASSMGDKEGMIGLADERANVQDRECIVFERPIPDELRHVHRDANLEHVDEIFAVFGLDE
jgi:hypothetical protein